MFFLKRAKSYITNVFTCRICDIATGMKEMLPRLPLFEINYRYVYNKKILLIKFKYGSINIIEVKYGAYLKLKWYVKMSVVNDALFRHTTDINIKIYTYNRPEQNPIAEHMIDIDYLTGKETRRVKQKWCVVL
jgi:hypothetical protein